MRGAAEPHRSGGLQPRSRALVHLILLLSVALPATLRAQDVLTIDQIRYANGTVNIQFTDARLATDPALNHTAQFSLSIGTSAAWTNINNAAFSSMPGNSLGRTVTLFASSAQGFYRILSTNSVTNVTTNDTDGDGLSNAFELANGSDPDRFDSDGDGFSDGAEYVYGTDPNDRNSFPVLTTLPRAEFAAAMSTGTEGAGPHGVTVRFDKPYFGALKIGALTNSTARPSIDYLPLPSFGERGGTQRRDSHHLDR